MPTASATGNGDVDNRCRGGVRGQDQHATGHPKRHKRDQRRPSGRRLAGPVGNGRQQESGHDRHRVAEQHFVAMPRGTSKVCGGQLAGVLTDPQQDRQRGENAGKQVERTKAQIPEREPAGPALSLEAAATSILIIWNLAGTHVPFAARSTHEQWRDDAAQSWFSVVEAGLSARSPCHLRGRSQQRTRLLLHDAGKRIPTDPMRGLVYAKRRTSVSKSNRFSVVPPPTRPASVHVRRHTRTGPCGPGKSRYTFAGLRFFRSRCTARL